MDSLFIMKAVQSKCVITPVAVTSADLVAFPDESRFPETKRQSEKTMGDFFIFNQHSYPLKYRTALFFIH
jgi:hypothetical protein